MRCALLDDLYEFPKFRRWLETNGGYRAAAHSAVQTHHIWGGKTRLNRPSNLLPLCLLVHHYIHNMETLSGRIACIWKRSSLPDFSWDELDACAGLKVRGWLEAKRDAAGEFRWMIDEVLRQG